MLDQVDPHLWQHVCKVIAIRLGSLEEVTAIAPALQKLRQLLPYAVITLMTSQDSSQLAEQLPWINGFLVYEETLFTTNGERELTLIEMLSHQAFDAAVIFTNEQESPYPLAYICYLAGIPIRIGQSREFGGGVLSQWIR
ncbi:MAG: hypothetical protein JOZ78_00375 [Chroococcidiopsidaceae cyanobacterium CP_BM_ER_R8_30]|nr:hypothetical protein [Chroococcidiopsidaceae cyanobacterium CP_BM_ER_R8_30]